MIDIVESLLNGEAKFPAAFKAAKSYWDSFFSEHEDDDDRQLAIALDQAQGSFQWAMEDVGLEKPFAKSIMALTCIGSLYRDGFEDRADLAQRLASIFVNSRDLSLSARGPATQVAALYSLIVN
ncbi:hypothetical protein [Rhizobium leguminosarum]|uniref:hypothetical protein n=1 Tax=Rhizobium leguminosarum TaxID=384 RepID=UPI003F9CC65D